MVVKLLYVVGFLSVCSAAALLAFCGAQWRDGALEAKGLSPASVVEKYQAMQGPGKQAAKTVESPLRAQAQALALYLDPPKPPTPIAETPQVATRPVPRPISTAPKFRLLSVSYYRTEPENSIALVSEPGKGGHWVKQGDRLGHLIVESIKDGEITYRDGDQVHAMEVEVRAPMLLARSRPATTVSKEVPRPVPTLGMATAQTRPNIPNLGVRANQNSRPSLRRLNASE